MMILFICVVVLVPKTGRTPAASGPGPRRNRVPGGRETTPAVQMICQKRTGAGEKKRAALPARFGPQGRQAFAERIGSGRRRTENRGDSPQPCRYIIPTDKSIRIIPFSHLGGSDFRQRNERIDEITNLSQRMSDRTDSRGLRLYCSRIRNTGRRSRRQKGFLEKIFRSTLKTKLPNSFRDRCTAIPSLSA